MSTAPLSLKLMLWCITVVVQCVFAAHFRGADFMVRPMPGGGQNEMEITYHISWRKDSSPGSTCSSTVNNGILSGEGSLTCQYGCSRTISSLSFICIEFSNVDNWSFGSHVLTHNFTTASSKMFITIGTVGGAWISPYGSWNISTTFNMTPRNDNDINNSSPRVLSLPLRLQEKCSHTIGLAVSDPDGDVIHCRWAVGDECRSVCNTNAIPGAVLNSATCTITYQATNGTGYKVVAVMVEDFIPGSSQPLSSVALQFVVNVISSSKSCSDKPRFLNPTPSSGAHITISPGGTFTAQLRADSGSGTSLSIAEIQIAAPIGLRKGGLRHLRDDDYYVSIIWTPHINQTGTTYHFCFVAINSVGKSSDQSCILLVPQCPTPHPMPFANKLSVNPHNVSLSITFNRIVCPSQMIVQVTFVEYRSNTAVYTTGSSSSEVAFNKPTQMTIRPKYMFTDGSTYYIKAVFVWKTFTDKTLWTFEVNDPAPVIVAHPTDTTAAAPFSGMFTCSARGYGAPLVVEWKRKSSALPTKSNISTATLSSGITTSTLVIHNVTSEDVGSYHCSVWNNLKGAQSQSANLLFSGMPIQPWVVVPIAQVPLTISNYNYSMKCMPLDNSLHYYWEKRNSTLPPNAHGLNTATLTINNLQPEDSGEYRCTVKNSTGSITSDYVKIVVKVSPPLITKQPASKTVNFYGQTTFECKVQAVGKTMIVWKRDQSLLPITASINTITLINEITSVLTITGVTGFYRGLYYCTAKNEIGETTSNYASLSLQVPHPEILEPLENITIPLRKTATLNCLALTYGGLKYEWKRLNGYRLSSLASQAYIPKRYLCPNYMAITHQLTIPNVQLSDEGWYCCVATNEDGNSEKCIWLEVDTLPTITKSPMNIIVRNKSVNTNTLDCLATGMGPIHYQWEKYEPFNGRWKNPSKRVLDATSPKLIFSVIREDDEGVYRCIVTNDDGRVVSDNATISVYGAPNITSMTSDTTSVEGSKVSLMCNVTNDVDALDEVKIVWLRKTSSLKEKKIEGNGNILVYNTTDISTGKICSVLLLDPVNHTDDGEYICRAFNNPRSYSEAYMNLSIYYPPVLTIIPCQSPYHVNLNEPIQFSCIGIGLPLPMVQWFSNGMAVSTAALAQISVTVESKHPHTAVYTCEGINHIDGKEHKEKSEIIVIFGAKCPTLANPANGTVIVMGHSAYHICNEGYVVDGNPFSICVNGKWTSPPAMCKLPKLVS